MVSGKFAEEAISEGGIYRGRGIFRQSSLLPEVGDFPYYVAGAVYGVAEERDGDREAVVC